MSQALDMIEGESFAILKEKINKAEKQSQELMRAQSQAEQESIQKKDQMDAELREREIGVKEQDLMLRAEDNEKDRQLQRELKIMEIQNRPQPQDTSGQEILKQRELQEKERANRAQESIKMEDIRSKEKIAKEKPKPTTSK